MGKSNEIRKKDKGSIIGICLAIVAIIAAVVTVVVSVVNGGVSGDNFVTTETRYVIEYPPEFFADESVKTDYTPNRVYVIYEHDGDTVNGKTMYYEYDDAGAASEAVELLKGNLVEEAYTEMVPKGKYVVITASDAVIDGWTMSNVESESEFVESMKKMYEDTTVNDETTTETVEETTTEAGETTTVETTVEATVEN